MLDFKVNCAFLYRITSSSALIELQSRARGYNGNMDWLKCHKFSLFLSQFNRFSELISSQFVLHLSPFSNVYYIVFQKFIQHNTFLNEVVLLSYLTRYSINLVSLYCVFVTCNVNEIAPRKGKS